MASPYPAILRSDVTLPTSDDPAFDSGIDRFRFSRTRALSLARRGLLRLPKRESNRLPADPRTRAWRYRKHREADFDECRLALGAATADPDRFRRLLRERQPG